ncbi:MAG: flagellar biosynthesis protein FlhF [Planctomycetota bacterium]
MAEALAQVKQEFGTEAVILSTRTISKNKVLGMGGGEAVEITAAEDSAELPPALQAGGGRARSTSRPSTHRTGRTSAPAPDASRSPLPTPGDSMVRPPGGRESSPPVQVPAARKPASPVGNPGHGDSPDTLLSEVGELKWMVQKLVRQGTSTDLQSLPNDLFATYQSLIKNAVAENLAEKLVLRVRTTLSRQGGPAEHPATPAVVHQELARALEGMLPVAEPIERAVNSGPTVVALVGPTGVGKTTTIAKLAANLSLRERKRIGLITLDTYRVAATEQLKTYAEIINIPLAVASAPEQLAESVRSMQDREVILVDTAGRSQRDADKLDELSRFFDTVRPHEVHLVLSSAGGKAVLQEAIRKFSVLGIDRVIFTKLDEAVGFGVLLDCLEMADARLSYLTTGQDVPNDIEVARTDRLARLLLTGNLTGHDKKESPRNVGV